MKMFCLFAAAALLLAGCAPVSRPAAGEETHEKPSYEILVLIETNELFLFCDEELFKTYPVAVGRVRHPTPRGEFTVTSMIERPYTEAYGTRWIGLSAPNIGIHGTDDPSSIGKEASGGCVRMKNADIEELFTYVSLGMKVFIL